MSGYVMHAGAVHEPVPRGQQSNFRGNPSWYDFGAAAVLTDAEGFCEVGRNGAPGLRHVAVRTCGRESTHRPAVANIAPRPKNWQPAPAPRPAQ